ncbi:HAD family hydrolase [Acrocarpospora catenulata]|uniref:HAD family hydrolase n=1 Tax=Acrocarpospora catenulata TaxID=2836182 RepID=UPI001BDA8B77|nr:HAD family hydrolase [Acrocarpospora catenulata]
MGLVAVRVLCIAADYAGTLTTPGAAVDPELGMRPVDPAAAVALKAWHAAGVRLLLVSNTRPGQDRRIALRAAGVEELFSVVLQSRQLGIGKPDREMYRMVKAAAGVSPRKILFIGDHLLHDFDAPRRHGLHAALIRPHGLGPDEVIPRGALVLPHVSRLSMLIWERADLVRQTLVERYEAGASLESLAEAEGVTRPTLVRQWIPAGMVRRNVGSPALALSQTEVKPDYLVTRYRDEGASLETLARETGHSAIVLRRWLVELGVEIRGPHDGRSSGRRAG